MYLNSVGLVPYGGKYFLLSLVGNPAVAAPATEGSMMGEAAASRSKRSRRVLIYGAGAGGQLLAREMRANRALGLNPVGFLDDDPAKQLRWILGVPVHGGIAKLEASLGRYRIDEIVLSSTSINGTSEEQIRKVCEGRGVSVRRLRFEIH